MNIQPWIEDRLLRHLRHNKGLRIIKTAIPPTWTPHPTTARKLGIDPDHAEYAKRIKELKSNLTYK